MQASPDPFHMPVKPFPAPCRHPPLLRLDLKIEWPYVRMASFAKLTEIIMPGQRPAWRFLTKDGDGKLHELGAAWATSKADVFGVTLDLEGTGEKIKFLMVKADRPKQRAQSDSAPSPEA
jgi:hypothetical protein